MKAILALILCACSIGAASARAGVCTVGTIDGRFSQISIAAPQKGETVEIDIQNETAFRTLTFLDSSGNQVADLTPNRSFTLDQSTATPFYRKYLGQSFSNVLTLEIKSADGILNIGRITEAQRYPIGSPPYGVISLRCRGMPQVFGATLAR